MKLKGKVSACKLEALQIEDNVKSGKEKGANGERPIIVTIVSAVVFLLGFGGLLLTIIVGGGTLLLRVDLPSFYLLFLIFGFVVIWPGLILAGYNLWKMKKWAGQLAVAIILFNCMLAIVRVNVSTLALDVIILASIGLAWKHLQ